MSSRPFALGAVALSALIGAAGCVGPQTVYTTQTKVFVNQTSGLWREANFKYVAVGLTGSASAVAGTAESKSLGRVAMDKLVAAAKLGPNQALVDVTIEQGYVNKSLTSYRVITLRGDVIEFIGGAK